MANLDKKSQNNLSKETDNVKENINDKYVLHLPFLNWRQEECSEIVKESLDGVLKKINLLLEQPADSLSEFEVYGTFTSIVNNVDLSIALSRVVKKFTNLKKLTIRINLNDTNLSLILKELIPESSQLVDIDLDSASLETIKVSNEDLAHSKSESFSNRDSINCEPAAGSKEVAKSIPILSNFVSINKTLKKIRFSCNNDILRAEFLLGFLKNPNTLEYLTMFGYSDTQDWPISLPILKKIISVSESLKEITCNYWNLNLQKDVPSVLKGFLENKNSAVETLNLHYDKLYRNHKSKITADGFKLLIQIIQTKKIKNLNLYHLGLDYKQLSDILLTIKENNAIVDLKIGLNEFNNNCTTLLSKIIFESKTLTDLDLCWADLEDKQLEEILIAVLANDRIKKLSIHYNKTGNLSFQLLKKIFRNSKVLEEVEFCLPYSDIRYDQLTELVQELGANKDTKISKFNYVIRTPNDKICSPEPENYNKFRKVLYSFMEKNTTLTTIWSLPNFITNHEEEQFIITTLHRNRDIRSKKEGK